MKRNRKESGFALLLEMLIVCMVLLILATQLIPGVVRANIAMNQRSAYGQVLNVRNAIVVANICGLTTGCDASNVTAGIPTPGTITESGYVFTYASASPAWSYVAVPVDSGTGIKSFYVAQDGVMRCAVGTVNGSSPTC